MGQQSIAHKISYLQKMADQFLILISGTVFSSLPLLTTLCLPFTMILCPRFPCLLPPCSLILLPLVLPLTFILSPFAPSLTPLPPFNLLPLPCPGCFYHALPSLHCPLLSFQYPLAFALSPPCLFPTFTTG